MIPCGKYWYKDRQEAREGLVTMLKKPKLASPHLLQVYECQCCEGWHIGHNWRLRKQMMEREG